MQYYAFTWYEENIFNLIGKFQLIASECAEYASDMAGNARFDSTLS